MATKDGELLGEGFFCQKSNNDNLGWGIVGVALSWGSKIMIVVEYNLLYRPNSLSTLILNYTRVSQPVLVVAFAFAVSCDECFPFNFVLGCCKLCASDIYFHLV
jgi:hypothetical protein